MSVFKRGPGFPCRQIYPSELRQGMTFVHADGYSVKPSRDGHWPVVLLPPRMDDDGAVHWIASDETREYALRPGETVTVANQYSAEEWLR